MERDTKLKDGNFLKCSSKITTGKYVSMRMYVCIKFDFFKFFLIH